LNHRQQDVTEYLRGVGNTSRGVVIRGFIEVARRIRAVAVDRLRAMIDEAQQQSFLKPDTEEDQMIDEA